MARKMKVFPTAFQKRASLESRRTFCRPANEGVVTRSHCIKTSTSAKTIGYAANAIRNNAYGAASREPDRCSARIDDLSRFRRRSAQRLPDWNLTVDRRL